MKRMIKVLNSEKVDRPPVGGITTCVTEELMEITGSYFPEAHKNYEKMAMLSYGAYEVFQFDTIKVPFCMTVEAEALGAKIDYGNRKIFPQVKKPLGEDLIDANIDLENSKRVNEVLKAIETLKKRNKFLPITSFITGPLSLLSMVYDFNETYIITISKPEKFKKLMNIATNLVVKYAYLQMEAGADIILIGEAGASGDLISPKTYKQQILPFHKIIIDSIKIPTVLHICGNITGLLDSISTLNINGLSFDKNVDLNRMASLKEKNISLVGYVPTNLLSKGSSIEVEQFSKNCLKNGVNILNPGCTLSIDTPNKNVITMANVSKKGF